MEKICFLTKESDCELTDVQVDGETYWVKEDIADEHPLKKLKILIKEEADKINKETVEKEEADKKRKEEALNTLTEAASVLGLSKADLGRLLLGQSLSSENKETNQELEVDLTKVKPIQKAPRQDSNDGFKEVDGGLVTSVRARVSADSELPASAAAWSSVKDSEGKSVREEGKMVKRLEDGGIVEKSNMGTTVIRMEHKSGSEVDKMLRQVDENGDLVRASVAGSGTMSGARTAECNLCNGSGITRIGHKSCPKCGGTGIVTV